MTEVDAQKKPRIRTRMGLATVQIKEREREICLLEEEEICEDAQGASDNRFSNYRKTK